MEASATICVTSARICVQKWFFRDLFKKNLFKNMIIGVLQLDLFISQAHSLKSKRQILKSLKDKIRRRFNVSIAEVGSLDKWQSHLFAVACINSDKKLINSIFSKIVNLVDTQSTVELVDYAIEFY